MVRQTHNLMVNQIFWIKLTGWWFHVVSNIFLAYYEEFKFQLERVKLLHTIVAPIDVLDTQMARLPLTAVAATLMTLWVIISSSQDSEFLGFYDDSFETVHTWLRGNYASKTAPMNKGEA